MTQGRVTLLLTATSVAIAASYLCAAEPAEPSLVAAVAAYQRGDWRQAASQFSDYLSQHPHGKARLDALFYLAEVLVQTGEYETAHARYGEYLDDLGDDPQITVARARYRRGETSYLLKELSRAEQELTEFLRLHPQDILAGRAGEYLAEIAMRDQRWADAQRYFEFALRDSQSADQLFHCQFGLARVAASIGDLPAARQRLAALSPLDHPGIDKVLMYWAMLELDHHQPCAARRPLEALLQRCPESDLAESAREHLSRCRPLSGEPAGVTALPSAGKEDADQPLVADVLALYESNSSSRDLRQAVATAFESLTKSGNAGTASRILALGLEDPRSSSADELYLRRHAATALDSVGLHRHAKMERARCQLLRNRLATNDRVGATSTRTHEE